MSAILIWGFGILLSLFIVFGKSHNEQDESGKLSRGFTDFAKFALVLSMYVISVQIIMAIVKIAMGFPINVSKGTSIEGMIFNALILIAEIFTLKKNKAGLVALIVLFIARMLLLVPMGAGSYSYFLGGNIVHFIRDFGLFAIAMCFKKNGISGWESILFADMQNATQDPEELQNEHTIEQEGVEWKSSFDEMNDSSCIIEGQPALLQNTTENNRIEGKQPQIIMAPLPEVKDTFSVTRKEKTDIPKQKIKGWCILSIALLLVLGGGCIGFVTYINSREYPRHIDGFMNRFRYSFSIPNNKLAWIYLSNYREAANKGLGGLSEDFLEAVWTANPNDITLLDSIGGIYLLRGHISSARGNSNSDYYEKAQKAYLKILSLESTNTKAMRGLIGFYSGTGHYQEAYQMAERILFNNPNDDLSILVMCREAYRSENWGKLLIWGRRGYELTPDADCRLDCIYYYSKGLYETGNKSAALRCYLEAEEKSPYNNLHMEFQEIGGIPCSIKTLSIQNETYSGEIIDEVGSKIYEDRACFLSPVIQVLSERNGVFCFDVKVYLNGYLIRGDSSPSGYSYSKSVLLEGSHQIQSIGLGSWGADQPGNWINGICRFEVWWEGNMLYSQSFRIY